MVIDHSFIDLQKLSFCISFIYTLKKLPFSLRLEDTVYVFLRILFEFFPSFSQTQWETTTTQHTVYAHMSFLTNTVNTVLYSVQFLRPRTVKRILRKGSREMFL
jgi:hypothetical protein